MSRKIYDIIPNEKISKKDNFCYREKKRKKNPFFFIFSFVILSLVGVFFFIQSSAEVEIYPNLEDVSIEASIKIDAIESLIDYEKGVLPGIIFSDVRESTEDYFSTGTDSKTKRATGVIRVYNKIKPSTPMTLRISTRFLSVPGGLTYRADKAFTIPGSSSDGTPGYVDINVTADEAGTEYNLSSATFSVPGLSGTEAYSNIWAETVSALGGGEESKIKIVTRSDLSSSEEAFKEKYIEEAKQALISSIPENYVYDPEEMLVQVKDFYVNAQDGAEVEKFSVYGKFESSILSTRKEDLVKMGEYLIKKEISDLKIIVPDSIFCEIVEQKNVENKIELKVVFTAKTYSLPQDNIVKESLINKNKFSSASILESMPEIDKVEINLFPFWRSVLPQKEESINIELKFND